MAGLAHGQVVRCTDTKTGKVTYTDGLCASTERQQAVMRKQTPEEGEQERAQASEARQRLNREIAALNARQAAERAAERAAIAQSMGGGDGGGGSANCAAARRDLAFTQSSRTKSREQKTAPLADVDAACGTNLLAQALQPRSNTVVRPNQPTILSSCDRGGCWDTNGGRYNRAGPNLIDSSGRVCRGVGPTMVCN